MTDTKYRSVGSLERQAQYEARRTAWIVGGTVAAVFAWAVLTAWWQ